ncbi:MAG: glycosyltransferase family 2 protein [Bacteroidales bacterium]|nr:glycosyltransferase family 2 protein [Bacteroidales bacterium]
MKISLVICLYNEEENIRPLLFSLEKSMTNLDFEVILVDDGSTDHTVKEVLKYPRSWLKLIRLTKNFGQSSALAAGIDHAKGEYIVTMDGDLQNDPADIPGMLKRIESEDCDIVAGYRENRKDNYLVRKLPSILANMLIRKTTGIKIRDYGCTLRIFRSSVAKDLKLYGELHRFIPVLASLEGANRIVQVKVTHHARSFGKSKYNMGRTLKVLSDLLLVLFMKRYMQKPMHLFGSAGVLLAIAGTVINIYLFWLKLNGQDIWGKPLLILGSLLFLAGIQLITTGIIADIQMRTYFESQRKKPYNIRSIKNFETDSQKILTDHSQVAC